MSILLYKYITQLTEMRADEIMNLINKRGAVAKSIFYCWIPKLIEQITDEDYPVCHLMDSVATISYNGTIKALNWMLENPEFFEKRCKINERNRVRMRKDLENMSFLEYPTQVDDIDFEPLEQQFVTYMRIE